MNLDGIKQIGIVGGGTAALMLCIEAVKLGIRTSILDPKVNAIGSQVASEHIISPITNESIQKLSLRCDCIIFSTKLDFELDVKLHAKTYPNKENMKELCHYKNVLDILEILEIPTMKTYYQDNKEQVFSELDKIEIPFRFIKQYANHTEQIEVYTKKDLDDFISEVDEKADQFIFQPITSYEKIIHCLCLVDETGKVICYDPIEEVREKDGVHQFNLSDGITKTMQQRLNRYNRKLIKEIQGIGAFTIIYGVKANKSVELVSITPEITMAALLTLEAYESSIYEQYLQMLLGLKVMKPELESYAHARVKETKELPVKDEVCHLYQIGLNNVCIRREKKN